MQDGKLSFFHQVYLVQTDAKGLARPANCSESDSASKRKKLQINNTKSRWLDWYNKFIKRHSDLLGRKKPLLLEPERAEVTPQDCLSFYEDLQVLIDKYRIHPALYANVDEKKLKALNRWRSVIFPRDAPTPIEAMEEKVTHVTLVPTVFADGSSLLPVAILNVKFIPAELSPSVMAGFHWAHQPSGWMTSDIFHWYVSKVFLPEIEKKRRALQLGGRWTLLLVDGHSSRKKPEMLQECLEHKIHVKTYVAHASNLMQVLDRGVFRAFKTSITT